MDGQQKQQYRQNIQSVVRRLAKRSKRRKLNATTTSTNESKDDDHDRQQERFVQLAASVPYMDSNRKADDTEESKDNEKMKKKFIEQDVDRYKVLLEKEQDEIQKIKVANKRVHQEQAELW